MARRRSGRTGAISGRLLTGEALVEFEGRSVLKRRLCGGIVLGVDVSPYAPLGLMRAREAAAIIGARYSCERHAGARPRRRG